MTTKTAVPESPVKAPTADWTPARPVAEPAPERRSKAQRGMPVAPALTAAGNAVGLAATGTYELGGATAVAVVGALAVVGGATAVAKRRHTVRRNRVHRNRSTLRHDAPTSRQRNDATFNAKTQRSLRNGSTNNAQRNGSTNNAQRNGSTLNGVAPQRLNSTRKSRRRNADANGNPKLNGATQRRNGQRFGGGGKSAALKAAVVKAAREKAPAAVKAMGRGVRKTWTADRSRKARGAVADGIKAAVPALWTAVRRRSLRAALIRLKEAWTRRRKARAERVPKEVTDSVRGATIPITEPTTSKEGITMPGHHFRGPAEMMADAAAKYDPQGMIQVGEDFIGLEEALRLVAEAMKTTVEHADAHLPLDDRIVKLMEQIYMLQVKAADLAAELKPAFESVHYGDLVRHRSPRKGREAEAKWDMRSNDGSY